MAGSMAAKNIGSMEPSRGVFRGTELVSLDMARPCVPEECPVAATCIYQVDEAGSASCRLQEVYLTAVMKKMHKCVKAGSEMDTLRVGMLIMPMFMQLIQLKIHENGTPPVYKGRVNAVLKESREVIKMLDSMLCKLGGDGRGIGGTGSNKSESGEAGFYEGLFEEGMAASAPTPPPKGSGRRKVKKAPLEPTEPLTFPEDEA